jgi:hypothetical protein
VPEDLYVESRAETKPYAVTDLDKPWGAGGDGAWLTADDGLRIKNRSPVIGLVRNNLPSDFADLDEDGNTTELLPYDAAGVAYPSNPPYNAGAYQTVAP